MSKDEKIATIPPAVSAVPTAAAVAHAGDKRPRDSAKLTLEKFEFCIRSFHNILHPPTDSLIGEVRYCNICVERHRIWDQTHEKDTPGCPPRPEPLFAGEYLVRELKIKHQHLKNFSANRSGVLMAHISPWNSDRYEPVRTGGALVQGLFAIDGKPFVVTKETCDAINGSKSPFSMPARQDIRKHMHVKSASKPHTHEVPGERIQLSTPMKDILKNNIHKPLRALFGVDVEARIGNLFAFSHFCCRLLLYVSLLLTQYLHCSLYAIFPAQCGNRNQTPLLTTRRHRVGNVDVGFWLFTSRGWTSLFSLP